MQIKENIKAPRHWPLCGEFTRGPVNSPHKWPVTRKMFPFDDIIMSYWSAIYNGKPVQSACMLHQRACLPSLKLCKTLWKFVARRLGVLIPVIWSAECMHASPTVLLRYRGPMKRLILTGYTSSCIFFMLVFHSNFTIDVALAQVMFWCEGTKTVQIHIPEPRRHDRPLWSKAACFNLASVMMT